MEQLTLFDINPGLADGTRNRPCDYRFQRSIGQRVRMMFGPYADHDIRVGTIKKIEPYFTTVVINGKEYAGTPYSLSPAE